MGRELAGKQGKVGMDKKVMLGLFTIVNHLRSRHEARLRLEVQEMFNGYLSTVSVTGLRCRPYESIRARRWPAVPVITPN